MQVMKLTLLLELLTQIELQGGSIPLCDTECNWIVERLLAMNQMEQGIIPKRDYLVTGQAVVNTWSFSANGAEI